MIAVAAISRNRIIGYKNSIPWHEPEDFKWFKELTTGGTLIMGRQTFVSLPKILPNRKHIVITRNPFLDINDPHNQVTFVTSKVHSYMSQIKNDDKTFLIGGEQIFQQFLSYCKELYLTVLNYEVVGDKLFPAFEYFFQKDYTVVKQSANFEVRHYVRII